MDGNGTGTAPEVFHRALDNLYRWMAEGNHPDGMTTIRTKDNEPGEPAVCADLSIIIYHEKPTEEIETTEEPLV